MSVSGIQKIRIGFVLSALVLLSGCGARPLAERAIIRGAFFQQNRQGGYTAALVLENTEEEGKEPLVSAAAGKTAYEALQKAEQKVQGEPFWGAADLVGLPSGITRQSAVEIYRAVQGKAANTPGMSVLAADNLPENGIEEKAAALYETMQNLQKKYKLRCKWENCAAKSGETAIPELAGESYAMLFLPQNGQPIRVTQPQCAQLAAVLCGQTDQLNFDFDEGKASCVANADLQSSCASRDNTLLVTLHLVLSQIRISSGEEESDAKPSQILKKELDADCVTLNALTRLPVDDPFHAGFWARCCLERRAQYAQVQVKISLEDMPDSG
jgi:hypothetical protein